MIHLQNVTKIYRTREGRKTVIDDLTVTFPPKTNIGILGRNGAGKSTLLQLLARAEYPTSGKISYDVSLSWPIAFTGAFAHQLSAIDNIRFISRIYGANWREVLDFVEDFAELGEYLSMPINTYSSGMRARLGFALSMAIEFDCYLIDEATSVGDKRFTERCRDAFAARRERSNVIIVSHSPNTIKNYCDAAYVLSAGKLYYYDNIKDAIEAYGRA